MADLQETGHGSTHDYDVGSPHLRHLQLRTRIIGTIRELISEQFAHSGACRVLEIGAGHGGFTDHIAAMGTQVTVTEMSRPSLRVLEDRFARNPHVKLLYDPTGEVVFEVGGVYDLVLCISVLHHIPDYLGFVDRLTTLTSEDGAFASFQDPLWYPRRSRVNLAADRAAFYFWRLRQGNIRRGLATVARRMRGVYDNTSPSDMVEYHAVRNGVDESALDGLLQDRFVSVTQWRYWSTQLPILQAAGTKLGVTTTFGIIGRGRRDFPPGNNARADAAVAVDRFTGPPRVGAN